MHLWYQRNYNFCLSHLYALFFLYALLWFYIALRAQIGLLTLTTGQVKRQIPSCCP